MTGCQRRRCRTRDYFLSLYLVAHLIARLTVPYADPYLLPMAGLLTAVGVTEIYRLEPDDAFRQSGWIVVGVGLFGVTLFGRFATTTGASRATSTCSASAPSCC